MKEAIKKIIEQRPYDATHKPGIIRLKIYTGPGINQVGDVFQSRGYYKESHLVYAVKSDVLDSFIQGNYYLPKIDVENIRQRLNLGSFENYLNEIESRETQETTSNIEEPTNSSEVIGTSVFQFDENKGQSRNLFQLLAFFNKEVHLCSVHPMSGTSGDRTVPGGVVNPKWHEVQATIKYNGSINTNNVFIVPSNEYPRVAIRQVPRGAGRKISEDDRFRL